MHGSIVDDALSRGGGSSRAGAAGEVALVFLVFFIEGAWPAPEVNEPHYLGKARHYWDAAWCANDFFCNSADAHLVFYWTFGWLTRLLPLAAVAWVGRVLTWGLLAWAWRRLSVALVPGALYAVLSATLFVVMLDRFHMSGEWVIGGVEAKGFAYVLVLFGLEALVRGRWPRAIASFSIAAALHVIVGGWSLVACGVAWLASRDRAPLRSLLLPGAMGGAIALAGLLPAAALTWNVDAATVSEANRIYVYERLTYHLLPQSMAPAMVVRHLLLVAALAALVIAMPGDARFRRLAAFIATGVGLAAVGMTIGLVAPLEPDVAARLLRFYWFRMSDVLVPLGVSLWSTAIVFRWRLTRPGWHAAAVAIALAIGCLHFGPIVWRRHQRPWPPADTGIANVGAWQEICQWAAQHTPEDAVFLTPRLNQTFRWYAGRAEVVTRKDLPQDARGIVEWWRRLNVIHRQTSQEGGAWRRSLAELGSQRLRELGREFGAQYVVTSADPPLSLPRVGPRNSTFAIYQLDGAHEAGASGGPTSPRAGFDPLAPPAR